MSLARRSVTPIMKKKASTQQGFPVAASDRDKALETALAQIERQFGKGTIMRLGDDNRPPIESIPTGSISLDVALGIGGIPRGRIVEIYGPESSGKCLTADTYVWTDRGLETVAEVFGRAGLPLSSTSRVTDVRDRDIRVVNEKGELEQVAALTHNGRQPVVRITVASGRQVTVTRNHPLRVMNDDGFIVWREAGQLREGDVLVSAAFGAVQAASGGGLSEDEAVLLGYLTAAGSLDPAGHVRFTTTDIETGAEFAALAEWLLDTTVTAVPGDGQVAYVLSDPAARHTLAERYGVDYAAAARIPQCVRTAGDKMQRAFLAALYTAAGWTDTSAAVGLRTASAPLAREVQYLLYGLGIPADLDRSHGNGQHPWAVTISPAAAPRFHTEVGFRTAQQSPQTGLHEPTPQVEAIPNLTGLIHALRDSIGDRAESTDDPFPAASGGAYDRDQVRRVIDWAKRRTDEAPATANAILGYLTQLTDARYTYEPITAVEDAGQQPTFDLMVPRTHSFLANGILSHNTTVALHAVANAQRAGGIAAFIDAEHALDPSYAEKIGVNIDDLLLSQPDTGEQALEIVDMLVRSGAISIIVIDSVAALVPRAEIEGEMGDSHVGLQARLMSQALRKIAGALNQTKTTAIFINQLREKVGVMFGCMHYDTLVTLADGTQEKIGTIVDRKLDVEVLSYDPETDRIVPRRVVNWFDNGAADHFLQFTVGRSGKPGGAQFTATPNHLIRTPGGWREAGELIAGDRVLVHEPHYLNEQQRQVVYGSLMGRGTLVPDRHGGPGVHFCMAHTAEQAAYLDWKVSLLGNIAHSRTAEASATVGVEFTPMPELSELHRVVDFGDGHTHLTWEFLKQLTPLALAVWYLDAGTLTIPQSGTDDDARVQIDVETLSPGSRQRLVEYLRDTHELDAAVVQQGADARSLLEFTPAATVRFLELVAPYVPESMSSMLLAQFRGRCSVTPEYSDPVQRLVAAPVLDIQVKPGSTRKFDIEVEGNHNYFVDGVMVHNSPETTSGGRALKFYASVRMDVRRIETLKDGTEAVGNRTRVKVVKNKLAPPFKQAEFDILYGVGISREGGLLDLGVEHGIVRKSGAWYTYEGTQLGQGKENARNFLRANPDMADEIEKRIKQKLGIPTGDDSAPAEEAAKDEAKATSTTKRTTRKTTASTSASKSAAPSTDA